MVMMGLVSLIFAAHVVPPARHYDGIAIDVGGPGFRFMDEFDTETCDAIRARLAPSCRIVMNVMVANDIDPTPDRIAPDLPVRNADMDRRWARHRGPQCRHRLHTREDAGSTDRTRSRDATQP